MVDRSSGVIPEHSPKRVCGSLRLLKPEAEEDSFPSFEGEPREGEAAGDLLEAESAVKLDRGRVSSVREEPSLGGALSDPVETCSRQSFADAAPTVLLGDKDSGEVIAGWGCVGWSLRGWLEEACAAVADDSALYIGDQEMVLCCLQVAEQCVAPVGGASLGRSKSRKRETPLNIGILARPNEEGTHPPNV